MTSPKIPFKRNPAAFDDHRKPPLPPVRKQPSIDSVSSRMKKHVMPRLFFLALTAWLLNFSYVRTEVSPHSKISLVCSGPSLGVVLCVVTNIYYLVRIGSILIGAGVESRYRVRGVVKIWPVLVLLPLLFRFQITQVDTTQISTITTTQGYGDSVSWYYFIGAILAIWLRQIYQRWNLESGAVLAPSTTEPALG